MPRLIAFLTAVALLPAMTIQPTSRTAVASSTRSSPFARKTCRVVKKKVHGKTKKVKVCTRVKPTATSLPQGTPVAAPTSTSTPILTSTPTATPTSTPNPATVVVSLAAAVPGYTFTENNGVYEVTDIPNGARVELSRFTVTAGESNGPTTYVLNFYVEAAKIPSHNDSTNPFWAPSNFMFRLVASNQHLYPFYGSNCSSTPGFSDKLLSNGESTQGWMCSAGIPAQNASGSYTLTWAKNLYRSATILNLAIATPSQ